MRIDDHNEMCGGVPDALTVWLSDEDIKKLKSKKPVKAENKKRGIKIVVLVNNQESQ
jgi:hypothetical protein